MRLSRRGFENPVIYALPRGGVAVAAEVAEKLDAPLDLILVRKIGAPSQPELALGAAVDGESEETEWMASESREPTRCCRRSTWQGNVIWQMTAAQLNQALANAGFDLNVIGTHHDFAVLPNGHLILIASMYQTYNLIWRKTRSPRTC